MNDAREKTRRLWRSLDELAAADDAGASAEFSPEVMHEIDGTARRDFLRVMAAALAMGSMSGCRRRTVPESVVPQARHDARVTPGVSQHYATSLTRSGYATGVVVRSDEGRPTKIDGNELHPSSLGATDAITQAELLSLYDPDRSNAARRRGQIVSADALWAALDGLATRHADRAGEGLHLVLPCVTSPTLGALIAEIRRRLPASRWYRHDTPSLDAAFEGARLATGRALEPVLDLAGAAAVLCLDADVFFEFPGACAHARAYTATRRGRDDRWRGAALLAAEPAPTITGARADRRLAVRATDIPQLLAEIADRQKSGAAPSSDDGWSAFVEQTAAALRSAGPRAVVIAGLSQPPEVHAGVIALNHALGALGKGMSLIEPLDALGADPLPLSSLAESLDRGEVASLMLLGVNPASTAPGADALGRLIGRAGESFHLGMYLDETARVCTWHAPMAHELESWGDARGHDGTAGIIQPLIEPLFGGLTMLSVLARLAGDRFHDDYSAVRRNWRVAASPAAEEWTRWVRDGVIPGTAARSVEIDDVQPAPAPAARVPEQGVELVTRPDSSVWDGRYANNAWLQELPRHLTTLTWDNAARLSPTLAAELGVRTGDLVRLTGDRGVVTAPAMVDPGHADGSVSLALGYGRSSSGRVGNGVGVDAAPLRPVGPEWATRLVSLERAAGRHRLALSQEHSRMAGRDLIRVVSDGAAEWEPAKRVHLPLYEPPTPRSPNQWGMTIDLAACIGCGACTAACQAENNIPTVGRDQVLKGREMHWIRVDRYYEGDAASPRMLHQPVPCMQCEAAPCELVCPVGATTHSDDGLNDMTYNRCVGTRYCSNNCPYKVRRFNFLRYTPRDESVATLVYNPRVTVRARGVMEKCTYCVQRIRAADMRARGEQRAIRDGEVVTACQEVCPTRAITFGDIADKQSHVSAEKRRSRNYALLEELNTRPRTSYLADVRLDSAQGAPG